MDLINKHFAQQINFIIIVLAAVAPPVPPAVPIRDHLKIPVKKATPSRGVHTAGIADDLTWILELAA